MKNKRDLTKIKDRDRFILNIYQIYSKDFKKRF